MKSIGFDPVLIDMLRSVSEFHDRWGIGRWKDGRLPPRRWMRGRADLIAEENTEFSSAPTLEDLAEEAADVLFVAIGTLDLLP